MDSEKKEYTGCQQTGLDVLDKSLTPRHDSVALDELGDRFCRIHLESAIHAAPQSCCGLRHHVRGWCRPYKLGLSQKNGYKRKPHDTTWNQVGDPETDVSFQDWSTIGDESSNVLSPIECLVDVCDCQLSACDDSFTGLQSLHTELCLFVLVGYEGNNSCFECTRADREKDNCNNHAWYASTSTKCHRQ